MTVLSNYTVEELLEELNLRDAGTLYLPVEHLTEDQFFSEPDENGVRTGLKPLFMTASFSELKADDGKVIASIRADLSGLMTSIDIRNQHCFVLDSRKYLVTMFDYIGDHNTADKIREMLK